MLTPEQKENLESWLVALQSGEYKQGQKFLRPTHDTFCCLGVVCDLYDKSVSSLGLPSEWNTTGTPVEYRMSTSMPPLQITNEWLGLPEFLVTSCAGMNDAGATFAHIVEFIRLWMVADQPRNGLIIHEMFQTFLNDLKDRGVPISNQWSG
jgi:hypothetical protein